MCYNIDKRNTARERLGKGKYIRTEETRRKLRECNKGKNNPMFGKRNKWGHHTEESKKKMSKKLIGRKLSVEVREKMKGNKNALGYNHTQEAKEKLSKYRKGKKLSKETRERMSIAGMGKIMSKETRRKISKTRLKLFRERKIKVWSKGLTKEIDERLKSISDKLMGKIVSEETKIKMSKCQKGRKVSEKERERLRVAGKISALKRIGKKFVEIYGIDKSNKIRKKMRIHRSKQILPVKDTSIEVKIQNFLKELGIEFFTHQYLKIEHGYQCDILIPSLNLVIECDGDYWHKYPVGKDIDHIRTKELIEKGFKVLRLWEHEINKMNLNKFRERLNGK